MRRAIALLVVCLFTVSSVLVAIPAQAHTTLGDYTPSFPFHVNDIDTHVAGPTMYVFPGSGLGTWSGTSAGFPPGYENPYILDQLGGTSYSPYGSILTSTYDRPNRGPLIFALAFSDPCNAAFSSLINCQDDQVINGTDFSYTGLTIYLPPEFDLSSAQSNYGLIQSTFSATAVDWFLVKASIHDPIGPGWWMLTFEGNIHFWSEEKYQEWFYVRINDVVAPKIAGKYFFKSFLWDINGAAGYEMNVPGAWSINGLAGTTLVPSSGPTFLTIPVENWPVLLVKGEVDPAIVTGTIRYGGFNQALYYRPINLPGRVWMKGTGTDPHTGLSTGRDVEAMGYFNATAGGHFEVEGVAPGVYNVYAQAAGYPTQLVATNVTIQPGQSFHLDGFVNPGVIVRGEVFSKHVFGTEPWPQAPRPVTIDIYNKNSYTDDNIVAWSPWNKTHAGYMAYDWQKDQPLPTPLPVAYPWDTLSTLGGSPYSQSYYGPKTFTTHTTATYFGAAETCGGTRDQCGKPDGVGRAQYWWVDGNGVFTNGGGDDGFIYQFGEKGVYGAPIDIDGHVPQPYATWVNGLTPGRYWVRAWINGYVQTLQDGVTLDEYYFDVAANEWAGDVFMPMDIRVSSSIVKTVHFHDTAGTLTECPINGCAGNAAVGESQGSRYLIAEVRDADGNLAGMNFTLVSGSATSGTVEVNGFGMIGPDPVAKGMKFSYYRYQGYHDYGIPSGTYTVRVYMRGYIQQEFETVSISLSGAASSISNHLYRGARFNITIYSIDWEHPRIQRKWEFPSARIRMYIFDQDGDPYRVGDRYWQPAGIGGSQISGNCALRPGELPDHCRIVEWDGAYLFGGFDFDTPPDTSSWPKYFGGFVTYPNLYNLDVITGRPLNEGIWNLFTNGFLAYPSYYRNGAEANFKPNNALESGTYSFYGYTYGYVQHQRFSVYAPKGGFADIRVQLLQGVNLTINIPFKTESIFSPTDANMTMRVRVFNDQGQLIAGAQTLAPDIGYFTAYPFSSFNPNGIGRLDTLPVTQWGGVDWTYYVDPLGQTPSKNNTVTSVDPDATADTFLWYGDYYGTGLTWQAFDSDVNHDGLPDFSFWNFRYRGYTAWIPAGTVQVRLFIAGVYDFNDPLNSLYTGALHGATYQGLYDWQMYGIEGYSSTIPNSYTGSYTFEVDTWNNYPQPTFQGGIPNPSNWYPPVQGLLEGDSFHTIPGSAAGPYGFVGDSLAANGLGPYAQRENWALPNTRLGGGVSGIFELDKRGYVSGNVYGFTLDNELRTLSWITVQAASAAGNTTYTQHTWDAHYDMYLDPGQYTFKVIAWTPSGNEAYVTQTKSMTVSEGQLNAGIDFQLERSNIPIPEIDSLAVVVLSSVAASLYLLRKRDRCQVA